MDTTTEKHFLFICRLLTATKRSDKYLMNEQSFSKKSSKKTKKSKKSKRKQAESESDDDGKT